MTDQAAQSKDHIDPRDVRFIVQADFHMASNNRPARDIYQMQNFVLDALDEGATEIRIRPYKQEGHADDQDGCGSEQRERVATPPPSPTPVQGREEALATALRLIEVVVANTDREIVTGTENRCAMIAHKALINFEKATALKSSSLPRGK